MDNIRSQNTVNPIIAASGLFPEGHGLYKNIYDDEYSKYVYEKAYTCPHCKKGFTGHKVFKSKLVSNKQTRFDMRKYYIGFNSTWYDVITCPHCYFSMFMEYYTEPKAMNKDALTEKLAFIKSGIKLQLEGSKDINTVMTQHYIAIECAESIWDSENIKMKLWSNLSWLYEDLGEKEMEIHACSMAAKAAQNVYEQSELSPLQEQLISLIVAGMKHRADESDGVRQWLFKAKTMKGGKKIYSDMADILMDELKLEQ